METKKERKGVSGRKPVAHFYDPRLIKEIVQAVETDTPRSVIYQQYGCSAGTLQRWMNIHGSPDYQQRRRRVYKPSEKRSVLRALASGMSVKEARISFGISNDTVIHAWMKEDQRGNYDLSMVNPDPMAKQLKNKDSDEVKALKAALAFEELKTKALNTLIDIAEEQFKIDIRKKPGARQSPK